jgi:hypothetical protein
MVEEGPERIRDSAFDAVFLYHHGFKVHLELLSILRDWKGNAVADVLSRYPQPVR